jgi:predicted dithiol-disulfide oxidoreductase (DUF899 family)
MTLHSVRFPGESDEYRRARDGLLRDEIALRQQIEAVAARRRALPPGGEVPTDYEFEEWNAAVSGPRTVRLSELFAGHQTLFVYSFMFKPGSRGPLTVACPLCTSIVDGLDGAAPHIAQRAGCAVVTKALIERFHAHAHTRRWRNVRVLSSAQTTYNADYHAEAADGEQFAMATTFTRADGTIRHCWSSELWFVPPEPGQNPRHVDFMWPLWSVLDRTADGRGDTWQPALAYR